MSPAVKEDDTLDHNALLGVFVACGSQDRFPPHCPWHLKICVWFRTHMETEIDLERLFVPSQLSSSVIRHGLTQIGIDGGKGYRQER